MKLKIEVELDNATFEDDYAEEVRRILDNLCERLPIVAHRGPEFSLHDVNGNYVGKARIT